MTINLGSIINLKYELEYKFKKQVYEQRNQAEEKAKVLTSLAFAELSSFFDKMHQFTLESELSGIDSDRSSVKSFVSTQFSMAAIKCSEIMSEIQAKNQAKINEYFSKKDEIEGKISALKNKITQRETTLSSLESKISNIETSVDSADTTRIDQLDSEIKAVQNDLEKTHTETVEDLMQQKAVSTDIKVAAAEVVKEETTKVTEAVKETNKQGTQPVDSQTVQLVFEFAKESKKVINDTSTTANIDDEKMNGIKNVDKETKNPAQLEFDFMKDEQPQAEKPAEPVAQTTPPANASETLLVDNADTKESNEKAQTAMDTLTTSVGIDSKQIDKAVEADAKTDAIVDTAKTVVDAVKTSPLTPTIVKTTIAAVEVVAGAVANTNKPDPVIPLTQEEQGKKNIEESVEKVKTVNEATSELTENVDKKIANVQGELTMVHSQLTDNKGDIDKETVNIPENANIVQPDANETSETKKTKIKEHSKNLKEVAQKQKEIIEVQKETIASLEKSAQKLIDSGSLDNLSDLDGEAKKNQELELEKLKETLEDSFSELDDLMKSIEKNLKNKTELNTTIDSGLLSKIDHIKKQSETKSEEIINLKKESINKDEKLNTKNSEIFFISSNIQSTDKLIENCKLIAENSDKIVVDKEMTGLYEKLSNILGENKVVLDRRGGSRRSQGDRRNEKEQLTAFGLTQNERKDLEQLKNNHSRKTSDRRDSSDRRQLDTNNILDKDDFNYFLKLKDNRTSLSNTSFSTF